MTIIFRGPGFEDCGIAMGAGSIIIMAPLAPPEVGAPITIEGTVKEYDGDPISVRDGEAEVGTVSNHGTFTRTFEASGGGEFSLAATGESRHLIGYLEIRKD